LDFERRKNQKAADCVGEEKGTLLGGAGAHFLLGAAGEQEENGLGASGGIAAVAYRAGSSAPPALGIAGRPCERALNECGEDCESLGASRLAHFGSVPSSVDERTLKGILLLLACCTQEESVCLASCGSRFGSSFVAVVP
jgi:hypothetical protein